MTDDSIRLPHDVKLYVRDDTGPLRQRPWPSVAFLVDGGLISDESCTSDHGSESGLDHGTDSDLNFSDFLEGDESVPNLESGMSDCSQTPIRSDPLSISHLVRGKKFRQKVKFRQFYEKPKFEAFLDPFVCEDVEDAHQVPASTTYPQEGVDPPLFQSLKQGLLDREIWRKFALRWWLLNRLKVNFAMSEGKRFSPRERTPPSLVSSSGTLQCVASTERRSSS